jgi:hypothetical protein
MTILPLSNILNWILQITDSLTQVNLSSNSNFCFEGADNGHKHDTSSDICKTILQSSYDNVIRQTGFDLWPPKMTLTLGVDIIF